MHRNLLRKAQCHGGWDWGPCLMVSGVYGTMRLVATSAASLVRVWTETRQGTSGVWIVQVKADVDAEVAGLQILSVLFDALLPIQRKVLLVEGRQMVDFEFSVRSPKLWNPAGYGEQNFYRLEVSLGGDDWAGQIGFRTLTWESKEDSWGKSLTCVVNGRPVFAKGANWIPADALPSAWTRETITARLEDAAAAHMNLIRVWGGGVYESEWFYQECSRLGLLVAAGRVCHRHSGEG